MQVLIGPDAGGSPPGVSIGGVSKVNRTRTQRQNRMVVFILTLLGLKSGEV